MASLHMLPDTDRPRERMRGKGSGALSDAELLALLLGSGRAGENALDLARRLLSDLGGLEQLAKTGLNGMARLEGIGEAKACRMAAALELGVRLVERTGAHSQGIRFTCSRDIFDAYHARLESLTQEVFLAVGLSNKNEPICERTVAIGTLSDCPVGPREVFRPMSAEAAARLAVLHNHPSGDPTPSPEDVALTRRLAETGELVGIALIDHLVIGRGTYVSFRDAGLLGR
ncbi:MAG TPA: DNA repair protein RadC [Polyangia bacterium]|nr:DNA repair protein RadC [Polyangia bacterium]